MDLPVHVAAGAVTGSFILYVESKYDRDRGDIAYMVRLGIACFLWGTLGHLILDALPHYDWLFKVTIFKPLPHYWMYPQLLTTVPVLLAAFFLLKDYWMIAVISILGGVYPDIEKLAYFDLHIPKSFVLFRWHSCFLSGRPWEYAHKDFLIATEIVLFFVMMSWMLWLGTHRLNRQNRFIPPLPLGELKGFGKKLLWAALSEDVKSN